MTFLSVQRYGLIFHRAFFDRHRLLFHYIPLACCVVYPTTLYVCLLIAYPCQNRFDYAQWTCGGGCYLHEVNTMKSLLRVFAFFCGPFLEHSIGR